MSDKETQLQRQRTIDAFQDRLYMCLDDEEVSNRLAEILKDTLFEEYKHHASKAERISKICNTLFPNQLPKTSSYVTCTSGSSRTILSVNLATPDYWHLADLAAAKHQCVMDYLQNLIDDYIKETKK